MKLYELTNNYQKVYDMADEDVDMVTWFETLESITDAVEVKVDGIAKLLKAFGANATAIKEEEVRLYNRRKAIENKQDNLKQYLQQQMELIGQDKIKTVTFTASIQNNPPSVNVTDQSLLSAEYIVTKIEQSIDRKKLLEDLKKGKEIPGAEIKTGRSLRIR